MNICVESLYSIDGGQTEKRRTLDMIRIVKGAVSVSKSKTGEVIYRHNKYDKGALKRQLDEYERNAERAKVDNDSQKRNALRKWSLVFERQKSVCDSLRKFDDLLDMALDLQTIYKDNDNVAAAAADDDDDDLQELKINEKDYSKERRLSHEAHTSGKCIAHGIDYNRMPKVPLASSGFLVQTGTSEKVPEKEKTAIDKPGNLINYDPKSETSFVREFLEEQKRLQEQLLTRNSLTKLKSSLEREHSFYKLRIQCRLPDDPNELLEKVEHDRILTRRASADRFIRSYKKGQGQGSNQRELTRRSSMIHVPCPSARRSSNDLDLRRSKTFHLY